jgi:hypothetical protein
MRTLMAAMVLAVGAGTAPAQEVAPAVPAKPRIDIVFCVDRSGSMQQVIETAKQKVWGIVNEVAKSKPSPILRIGLIGYGSADQDVKFFPLSEDLDKVYENLMTFKVDMGGDEWVGWAAKKAAEEMLWAKEGKVVKIIFMVGNETAAQGRPEVLYTKTVPEIIKKDIVVNAIYCGRPGTEEERTWREVAGLADGQYTVIDLSGGVVTVATPMDKELMELSQKLNGTYVEFGREGADRKENQARQDANAAGRGAPAAPAATAAERAVAKAGAVYHNSSWDLVDASKDKAFKIEEVKNEDLPKEMQGMTLEQKKAHIAQKAKEREELQKKINELGKKRQEFIAAEIKAKGLTQDKAFDEAVRKAVREQAEKRGLQFEK